MLECKFTFLISLYFVMSNDPSQFPHLKKKIKTGSFLAQCQEGYLGSGYDFNMYSLCYKNNCIRTTSLGFWAEINNI